MDGRSAVTAFLNPPISNDNVYMSMPPGVEILGKRFSTHGRIEGKKGCMKRRKNGRMDHVVRLS